MNWYKCNFGNYEINELGDMRTSRINKDGKRFIKPSKQNQTIQKVESLYGESFKMFHSYKNIEYFVSNVGRLKSRRYIYGTPVYTEKLIKQRIDKDGYKRVCLYYSGYKGSCLVHRIVAKEFLKSYDENLTVNHINAMRQDNRVENMEMCSSVENVKKGATLRREKGFKLGEHRRREEVEIRRKAKLKIYRSIIEDRLRGNSLKFLSEKYGKTTRNISFILMRYAPETKGIRVVE